MQQSPYRAPQPAESSWEPARRGLTWIARSLGWGEIGTTALWMAASQLITIVAFSGDSVDTEAMFAMYQSLAHVGGVAQLALLGGAAAGAAFLRRAPDEPTRKMATGALAVFALGFLAQLAVVVAMPTTPSESSDIPAWFVMFWWASQVIGLAGQALVVGIVWRIGHARGSPLGARWLWALAPGVAYIASLAYRELSPPAEPTDRFWVHWLTIGLGVAASAATIVVCGAGARRLQDGVSSAAAAACHIWSSASDGLSLYRTMFLVQIGATLFGGVTLVMASAADPAFIAAGMILFSLGTSAIGAAMLVGVWRFGSLAPHADVREGTRFASIGIGLSLLLGLGLAQQTSSLATSSFTSASDAADNLRLIALAAQISGFVGQMFFLRAMRLAARHIDDVALADRVRTLVIIAFAAIPTLALVVFFGTKSVGFAMLLAFLIAVGALLVLVFYVSTIGSLIAALRAYAPGPDGGLEGDAPVA